MRNLVIMCCLNSIRRNEQWVISGSHFRVMTCMPKMKPDRPTWSRGTCMRLPWCPLKMKEERRTHTPGACAFRARLYESKIHDPSPVERKWKFEDARVVRTSSRVLPY
jgi:hypothetical protein